MLAAMCIGFIFDLRAIILKFTADQSECYSLATAYFTDLLQLLVSCVFACVYFSVVTMYAFRDKKTVAQSTPIAVQTTVAAPEKGE